MSNTPEKEREGETETRLLQLYRTYGDEMFQVANVVLQNEADAEDVVQLALIKLLKGIHRFQTIRSEGSRGIVLVVTMNTAVEYCQERNRHCHLCWEDLAPTLSADAETGAEQLSDHLAIALARLPDHYREALMLRYHGGFTTREIAEMMSTTQRRARQTVQKAREALKQYLEEDGVNL